MVDLVGAFISRVWFWGTNRKGLGNQVDDHLSRLYKDIILNDISRDGWCIFQWTGIGFFFLFDLMVHRLC